MRFWSIGPPVAFLDDHHGSLACVDHARNIRKRSGEIVGVAGVAGNVEHGVHRFGQRAQERGGIRNVADDPLRGHAPASS